MGYDEDILKRICPCCHMGVLRPHSEVKYFHLYEKCESCGYTQEVKPNG